eukprot:1003742-Ditylum_brightwellii.AAC.1
MHAQPSKGTEDGGATLLMPGVIEALLHCSLPCLDSIVHAAAPKVVCRSGWKDPSLTAHRKVTVQKAEMLFGKIYRFRIQQDCSSFFNGSEGIRPNDMIGLFAAPLKQTDNVEMIITIAFCV